MYAYGRESDCHRIPRNGSANGRGLCVLLSICLGDHQHSHQVSLVFHPSSCLRSNSKINNLIHIGHYTAFIHCAFPAIHKLIDLILTHEMLSDHLRAFHVRSLTVHSRIEYIEFFSPCMRSDGPMDSEPKSAFCRDGEPLTWSIQKQTPLVED